MSRWAMSRWRLYSIVVEAAIAWVAFFADPLGLTEQKTRALNDYLAVATQYGHGPAPKDVAVVLVDRESLKDRRIDWPLPYDTVADLIGELRCAQVKGVFFDFTASREFTPANPDERLRAAIEGESKTRICADGGAPADAPVFFGRVEGFETPLGHGCAKAAGPSCSPAARKPASIGPRRTCSLSRPCRSRRRRRRSALCAGSTCGRSRSESRTTSRARRTTNDRGAGARRCHSSGRRASIPLKAGFPISPDVGAIGAGSGRSWKCRGPGLARIVSSRVRRY